MNIFLTRLDRWLGRTLFIPVVVRICLLTRQSQYAISRLFWFSAVLDGLYRASTELTMIVFFLLSLFMMIAAALHANRPTGSFLALRIIALCYFIGTFLGGVVTRDWRGTEFWGFVLFAEYAATIRKIPEGG